MEPRQAIDPVLSRLTLALLQDSGWYLVDYDKAQVVVAYVVVCTRDAIK
jgi:hypothetical protein